MNILKNPMIGPEVATLVPLLNTAAALIDRFGTLLVVNDAFSRFVAIPTVDMLHTNLFSLTDSDVPPGFHGVSPDPPDPVELTFTARFGATQRNVVLQLKPCALSPGTGGYLVQPHAQTETDAKLRFFVDDLDHGVWEYDTRRMSFAVSDRWRVIRGLGPDDPLDRFQGDWLQEIHPDDREDLRTRFEGQAKGDCDLIRVEYRARHAQGHWIWILCRGSILERDSDGTPTRIVGTDTDITHLKEKEQALSELTDKMEIALDASGIGIWEFHPQTNTEYWDDRMLEIYGMTRSQKDNTQKAWERFLHPDDKERIIAYADDCLARNADFCADYRILRPDGQVRHVRSIARASQAKASLGVLIGVNFDVTVDYQRAAELEEARRQLEHDSRHDALTGLPNRRLLEETASDLIDTLGARDTYGVMHVDLDQFKRINDTLGHAAGDAVLTHVGQELRRIVPKGHLTCRIGGDEFVILTGRNPDPHSFAAVAERIVAALSKPFVFQGHTCRFGASVGLAIETGPPARMSEMFLNADHALYAAKHAGRGCVRRFDPARPVTIP